MIRPPWLTDELIAKAKTLGDFPGRPVLIRELGMPLHKAATLAAFIKAMATDDRSTISHLRKEVKYLTRENEQLRADHGAGIRLAETFAEAIAALPSIPVSAQKRKVDAELDPEDIVLYISDVQIGQRTDPVATGGLGNYSTAVFRERLETYLSAVRRCLRYHPNPVERCVVVFGGDIVDGSTIYRNQARQIDLATVRQVVTAYEMFGRMLAELAGLFKKVTVLVIPGNHGRIGERGQGHPADNLDWLLGYFLRERFKGHKGMVFHLPETWWALLRVRNTTFLVAHGDEFRAWMGIPFYGARRWKGNMRELLRTSFHSATGSPADFDAVLVGHHHEIAEFSDIYMNGCWPGGSEYSLHDLAAGGRPHQWMLGVHDRTGIAWTRKIQLQARTSLPAPPILT